MNKNELFLFSISLILNMYRELSAIDFLNMCLMAVFLGGGLVTGLETFLGWLTKVLNEFTSEGHEDRSKVHLDMDTHGAETVSSYPGLDTHSHTHVGERTVGDTRHWGWQWNLALFPRDTLMWQYCHVSQRCNIGFSLCAAERCIYLYTLFIRSHGWALAFFLYK